MPSRCARRSNAYMCSMTLCTLLKGRAPFPPKSLPPQRKQVNTPGVKWHVLYDLSEAQCHILIKVCKPHLSKFRLCLGKGKWEPFLLEMQSEPSPVLALHCLLSHCCDFLDVCQQAILWRVCCNSCNFFCCGKHV